jgi:hypothetical protein
MEQVNQVKSSGLSTPEVKGQNAVVNQVKSSDPSTPEVKGQNGVSKSSKVNKRGSR